MSFAQRAKQSGGGGGGNNDDYYEDPFSTAHYADVTDMPELARLQRKQASEEPVMHSAPLSEWPEAYRAALYKQYEAIGDAIAKNRIWTPANKADRDELERLERMRAPAVGSAGIGLLKMRRSTYDKKDSLTMDSTNIKNIFDEAEAEEATHKHTRELTFIVDVRFVRQRADLLFKPFEEMAESRDAHWPYMCLSITQRSAISRRSSHASFLSCEASLRSPSTPPMTLGAMIARIEAKHGLVTHAVLFRHDAMLELVVRLDLDGFYFGVISLALCKPASRGGGGNGATFFGDQLREQSASGRELRRITINELRASIDGVAETDAVPVPTIGPDAAKVLIEQLVAAKAGVTTLSEHDQVYYDFLGGNEADGVPSKRRMNATEAIAFNGTAPDSPDARLLARCTSLAVYEPLHSKTLQAAVVSAKYGYIVTCQCLMHRRDLRRFKKTYCAASRAPELTALPTLDRKHMPPTYDSDNDTSDRHEQGAVSSSSASTTVQSAESRERELVERNYTASKKRPHK